MSHFSGGSDNTYDSWHALKDECVPGSELSAMMVLSNLISLTIAMSEASLCLWFPLMRAWVVFPGQLSFVPCDLVIGYTACAC